MTSLTTPSMIIPIQSGMLISPKGRPFRFSGVQKNGQLPSKWINNTEHWHWIYTFIFLDNISGFFYVEIDYYNKFVYLCKTLTAIDSKKLDYGK